MSMPSIFIVRMITGIDWVILHFKDSLLVVHDKKQQIRPKY